MKSRHHFFIDDGLNDSLDKLTEKGDVTRSSIVEDALRAFLNREVASELDEKFKYRLDRHSLQLGRIERDVSFVMESLALFIHNDLAVTAQIAEDDQVSRDAGRLRFEKFLEQVCRLIASNKGVRARMLARDTDEDGDGH